MNKLSGKKAIVSLAMVVSVFGLASAPLSASAQSWNNNWDRNGNSRDNDRRNDDRRDYERRENDRRWNNNRNNRERQAWRFAQNRSHNHRFERTARWNDNRGETHRFRLSDGRSLFIIFARNGQVVIYVTR